MKFFILFVFLVSIKCLAQDSVQIHLHLDRGAYFPGDTIRYKAYVLTNGILDHRIKNLYIDWFGSDGDVFENSVHLLEYGMTSGQYAVPSTYKQIWVNTCAFTNVNRENEAIQYYKHIPVLYNNLKPESSGMDEMALSSPIERSFQAFETLQPKIIAGKRNPSEKRLNQFRIGGLDEPAFLTVSVSDAHFPAVVADVDQENASSFNIPTDFKDSLMTVTGQFRSGDMPWVKFLEKYQKAIQKSVKKKKSPFSAFNFSLGYKSFADSKYIYSAIPFDRDGYFHIKGLSFVDTLEFRATHVYESMKYDRFTIEYSFLPSSKRAKIEKGMPSYPYYNKEWPYDLFYIVDTNRKRLGLREITITGQKKDGRLQELDSIYPKDWFKDNRSVLDIDAFKEQENCPDVNDVGTLIYRVAKREGVSLRRIGGYYKLKDNWQAEVFPDGYKPIELPPINQIRYIKVYDKYPLNPLRNGEGALMFYTTGPDGRNIDHGRKVNYTKVGGYKAEIPYWKKKYKSNDDIYLSEYDDRISLFWDSNVNLNAKQDYSFEFYNNSRQGEYVITVQGFTLSGKPVFVQAKL